MFKTVTEIKLERFKTLAHVKATRKKPPMALTQALKGFFQRQAKAIMGGLKSMKAKAITLENFNVDHWTREMLREMSPVVQSYYDYAAKQTLIRLGGNADLFRVVQPHLREGVEKASLLFCEETNKTTHLELTQALAKLKDELNEGLTQGDVKNEMMKRVQSVFQEAEVGRAFKIGVTEANRAQHAALELTAQKTGLASGKRWILSSDACEICKGIYSKNPVVKLGENFAVLNDGPYGAVPYPPAHVLCRCDCVEVIQGVND